MIHVYVVNNWVCTSLLWSMVQVVDGSNVNNLTFCVMEFLLLEGILSQNEITLKFIVFCVDGVSIFQGTKLKVTTQNNKHGPILFYKLIVFFTLNWFGRAYSFYISLGVSNGNFVSSFVPIYLQKSQMPQNWLISWKLKGLWYWRKWRQFLC